MILRGYICTAEGNISVEEITSGMNLLNATYGERLIEDVVKSKYTGKILDFGDFAVTADTVLITKRGTGLYNEVTKNNVASLQRNTNSFVNKSFTVIDVEDVEVYEVKLLHLFDNIDYFYLNGYKFK
jgi:hypothetical protein